MRRATYTDVKTEQVNKNVDCSGLDIEPDSMNICAVYMFDPYSGWLMRTPFDDEELSAGGFWVTLAEHEYDHADDDDTEEPENIEMAVIVNFAFQTKHAETLNDLKFATFLEVWKFLGKCIDRCEV